MKIKIKSYYTILILLNILSVFFVLQIKLKLIPLFQTNSSTYLIKNINDLIVNLSVGMILSTLFFIIVVLLPELIKRKSTLKIIQARLDTIGNELNHSMFYFTHKRMSMKIDSLKKLQKNDFKKISGLSRKRMNFKYTILGTHGHWIPFSSGEYTELDFFINQKKIIIKKIDEIFSLPTITQVDDELIEILAELRDCHFYGTIRAYERFGEKVSDENFNQGIYEYYRILKKLKKYCTIHNFKVRK